MTSLQNIRDLTWGIVDRCEPLAEIRMQLRPPSPPPSIPEKNTSDPGEEADSSEPRLPDEEEEPSRPSFLSSTAGGKARVPSSSSPIRIRSWQIITDDDLRDMNAPAEGNDDAAEIGEVDLR